LKLTISKESNFSQNKEKILAALKWNAQSQGGSSLNKVVQECLLSFYPNEFIVFSDGYFPDLEETLQTLNKTAKGKSDEEKELNKVKLKFARTILDKGLLKNLENKIETV